jgi:hypothetical protein
LLKFLPSPAQLLALPAHTVAVVKAWCLTYGIWWGSSMVGHAVLLTVILLLLGKVGSPPKEGEAPAFEARLDTEIPVPQLDHFDVGQTPLEPSELNTETLSLVDAPKMEADPAAETSDAIPSGGGSGASPSGGIGGLDQFAVKALGPGPLVRGTGMAASGTGRGPGSGGAGNGFGARGDKNARAAMVGGYGGTKASERAVAAALNWFARHQNADGGWSVNGFIQNCNGDPCTGPGTADRADSAATAMALLPFLAAGQTHFTKGPYRDTIAKGIGWLISHQKQDGDLRDGGNMYSHGLAAITLCEATALTKDKDSRVHLAAQGAIAFIVRAQYESGGWHYTARSEPDEPPFGDTSVVGWQVMALKSAQMAGLEVPESTIAGSHKWLKATAVGKYGGQFSYQPNTGATASMTSVGLLCTQYLGAKRDSPSIQEGMAYLLAHLPDPQQPNCYYWYYATQVMHNLPGPAWDTWNRQMRRVLIDSQIKKGCAEGSWDPLRPIADQWGEPGGRIMVTSLSCLTLEVYYRYLPLYKLDNPDATANTEQTTTAGADGEAKP